jgi:DNA polymerase-1
MYLTPTKDHWACDIEADNLLDKATRIWCVCVCNLVTKEEKEFTDAESFKNFLAEAGRPILVGHNFIAYDLVMLTRHWGCDIHIQNVVDTFVLSQLYNPNMRGGHSLEAWGERLNYKKGDHNDFTRLTDDMRRYCRRDTRLTGLSFIRLSERMRMVGFTELGAEIEHLAWNIIQNKQRVNGFPFDRQKAEGLYATLRAREEELKSEIYKLWPPELRVVGEYQRPYNKNGSKSLQYQRHLEQYPKVEETDAGRGYRVYDWVSFNLGSPKQRIEKLLSLGWEPVNKTAKGNPKVDEDELLAFAETSGKPEIAALAKWIVFNSRANMVRTWLDALNPKTGAIHGRVFIASTLRYRHSNPNSANIPAVRLNKEEEILYGESGGYSYEARDCWYSGSDGEYVLVGVDGTGIQNRCLIHHLIRTVGEEAVAPFKELALKGDVHKRNIEILGLANKAAAKKFYYTLMMGGGGERLAADQAQFGTKMTAREGSALRKKMIESIPGFRELIRSLEDELEATGRIRLCDNTPILVPSPHMVIPYLLQGDESRLMKQAMIYTEEEIERNELRAYKVADIHDEWQHRVKRDHTGAFIEAALASFPRAGERFGYNIPIEGDAKEGKTWAETH